MYVYIYVYAQYIKFILTGNKNYNDDIEFNQVSLLLTLNK